MKPESLSFQDKFNILLDKMLSGVAELKYIRLYGKSRFNYMNRRDNKNGDQSR